MWNRRKVENYADGWTRSAPERNARQDMAWPSDQQGVQLLVRPVVPGGGYGENPTLQLNMVDSLNPTTVYPVANATLRTEYTGVTLTQQQRLFIRCPRIKDEAYKELLLLFAIRDLLGETTNNVESSLNIACGLSGLTVLTDWDPTTLTWNNQPSASGAAIGTACGITGTVGAYYVTNQGYVDASHTTSFAADVTGYIGGITRFAAGVASATTYGWMLYLTVGGYTFTAPDRYSDAVITDILKKE